MAGRYPYHLQLAHGVIGDGCPYGLNLSETTLADQMKKAGYATHAVGKIDDLTESPNVKFTLTVTKILCRVLPLIMAKKQRIIVYFLYAQKDKTAEINGRVPNVSSFYSFLS